MKLRDEKRVEMAIGLYLVAVGFDLIFSNGLILIVIGIALAYINKEAFG